MSGSVLILVPHMDDEILGCGATLAGLGLKNRAYFLFVTAGGSLPAGCRAEDNAGLLQTVGDTRRKESWAALSVLGVPPENLHFLDVPEGGVAEAAVSLEEAIFEMLEDVQPDTVLIPFRFDQHHDHVALNRIARAALRRTMPMPYTLEYFVYTHLPLLLKRDIREFCRKQHLLTNPSPAAETKLTALRCFTSQTTLFYQGQVRPVLSEDFLREMAEQPEMFLRADADAASADLLNIPPWFLGLAQWLQPRLKWVKETVRCMVKKAPDRRAMS